MPQHLVVKKSRNGLGIFTAQTFKNATVLFPVRGKRMNYKKVDAIGGTFQDNTFRYGPETYISPQGELADYQNHSCEPNAKVVKKDGKLYVVSIRALRKNEEILIDYSTILAQDDVWTMRCNCGSKQCRKKIVHYTKLPKVTLEKYKTKSIIPPYILHI